MPNSNRRGEKNLSPTPQDTRFSPQDVSGIASGENIDEYLKFNPV